MKRKPIVIELDKHLKRACAPQRAKFRKLFGKSAELTEENIYRWLETQEPLFDAAGSDLLWWLCGFSYHIARERCLAFASRGGGYTDYRTWSRRFIGAAIAECLALNDR